MAKPTVVLVHGAFADGSSWGQVIPLIAEEGYQVVAVQNPLTSLADDVHAVYRVIDMHEGPILLAGHSWGGAVITEAGNHPAVKALVYVAAGAPDNRQSFNDWWKGYPPAAGTAEMQPYGPDYVALTREGIRHFFVQDISLAEADFIYATQAPLAVRCFSDPVSHAAWRYKPAWYIVAENDQTISPAIQRDSAQRMRANTVMLDSGHVPMLSQPSKVSQVILGAARAIDF